MQNIKKIIVGFFTLTLLVLGGCSGGGSDTTATTSSASVNGVAQKGPFLQGSVAKIYKLDANYDRNISQVVQTTISNDEGAYSFTSIPWIGLSEIEVSGYFLDENTGATDRNATVTSIVNVTAGGAVNTNVNVLTHMASAKVKELLREGKSLDEANEQVVGEVFGILGRTDLGIDDFGDLDLTDLLGSNATANTELLLLSAALLQSDNYMQDLEALLALYREGGIEAVLGSSLYAQLMQAQQTLDVTEVVGHVSDEVNPATITLPARIQITKNIMSESIEVQLYGTEFIDTNPSISFIVEGGEVTQGTLIIADNNKSASIAVSGDVGGCKDVNVTLSIDYMSLKDVDAMPLMSNKINMHPQTLICAPGPDDNTTDIIVLPDNQDPVAYIGTRYSEDTIGGSDADQEEQYATTAVGVVNNYIGEYSYDRDLYPMGAIVHCQWENNASEIVVESDDAECNLDNLVFDTAGVYDYTLKVRDNRDANDSNVLHITVEANTPPSVTLQPSEMQEVSVGETLQITAKVVDSDIEDSYHMQWMYSKIGSPTSRGAGISENFSHIFSEVGEYNVSVSVVDSHGARAEASLLVNVIAQAIQNHAPTVRISPAGEKNLSVGERLLLKSIASDDDNDTLSYAWSLKESTALEYTDVATYGATGFSYEFNAVGTYIVRVDVNDSKGGLGDANITVNVTAPVIVTTLEDINITLAVKGEDSFVNGGNDRVAELVQAPQHGLLEFYLIGNEVPSIKYTSQDCFVGEDSFIYKSGNDYGRVNVTITSPSSLSVLSEIKTLFNTQSISGEFLRAKNSSETVVIITDAHGGDASFTVVGNEIINYNYDPDDTFVGNDFFEYTVSETINECSYSKTGRIEFDVQTYVAEKKVISTCRDPYLIGTELYSTEGTLESTQLMKDLTPGVYSTGKAATTGFMSIYSDLKIGNVQYFVGYYSAGGTKAFELYETQGTPETTIVHDLNPHNVFTSEYLWGSSNPGNFVRIEDQIFFMASDSNYSRYGMYKADGVTVERIADNATDQPFVKLGGDYYYLAQEDDNVTIHKFASDFSSSEVTGSFQTSTSNRSVDFLAVIGDKIIFTEYENSPSKYTYFAVTTSGVVESLTDLTSTYSKKHATINDKVYFFSNNNSSTNQVTNIIETDANTTNIVATFDGGIYAVAVLNDKLYFKGVLFGENWNRDINLYEFTPSTGNIVLIADIAEGDSDDIGTHHGMSHIDIVDGKLIYESVNVEIVDGEKKAYELVWASDGTAAGTRAILRRDRSCVSNSCQAADIKEMFELNGAYYFQDVIGRLYRTDFSEFGTTIILDEMCDITPNYLEFQNITDAQRGVVYEGNLTVVGISYPETKLRIENGEYSLDNGVSWSSEVTTVANGQSIKVRHTSSSEYDTRVDTILYVGLRHGAFSTTTETETLSTPNQFIFADIANASVSTVQTANVTISGINTEVALSITGGEYSLDSQSTWKTSDANVTNAQVVYVRHTSSSSNEVTVDTILTVGGVSDTFSSTTRAAATNNGETIAKDALMWEDTEHTRTATQTWQNAYSYCADLVLADFDDWRLPDFSWETELNELGTIMIGSDESTEGDRVIDEDFVLITQGDSIGAWTSEQQGDTSHVVGFFTGGSTNFDGMGDSELVGVRCVRDVEQ